MKSVITKEELAELPVEGFDKPIVVVERQNVALQAIEELSKEAILGFDTETRPSFKSGEMHQVALVQLSTDSKAYLFRLNKLGIYAPLFNLLNNKNIIKVGLAVDNDLRSLCRLRKFDVKSFVELQTVAQSVGIESMSLQKIYAILFGKKISKRQRLSNWEAEKLTQEQCAYAALDAWSCLRMYNELEEIKRKEYAE